LFSEALHYVGWVGKRDSLKTALNVFEIERKKLMNWLTLLLQILTAAPSIIHGVETAIGPSKGAEKKAAVLAITSSIATVAGATPAQVDTVSAIVSTVADATVQTLNAVGTFKKSAVPAK
jgi:hypothetical protein